MSTSLKNIIIIGASGSIGKHILAAFTKAPSFTVTVLTRTTSTASFPLGIQVLKSDYTLPSLAKAFTGQDAVISVVGLAGFLEQKIFIDAAILSGSVKRFIPSEFSSNTLSPAVLELLPAFGQKIEILEYLKGKEKDGLTWSAIWTGLLFDDNLENGFLGYNLNGKSATIWDTGDKKFTLSNIDQLQRAVVAVLERADETVNKNIYIASVETSQNEILAALEEVTSSKWTVQKTTTKKEVDEGRQKLSKGDFSGALALVRATSFADVPDLRANFVREEVLSHELLGLEMGSVRDTVKRVMANKF